MNKEQWEIIRDDIIKFNRLIHTEDFRKTEKYINLCYDITQEESDEQSEAFQEMWKLVNPEDDYPKPSNLYLDGVADTAVTAIQLVDAITPSQLEWDYIGPFFEGTKNTDGIKHFFLSLIVDSILDVEFYGVDIVGALAEVNRSNMSKVPTLQEVQDHYGVCPVLACNAAAEWIQDQLGEGWVISWEHVKDVDGVTRAVFKDQFGKVRKLWCYFEPDLSKYLGV